MTCGGILEADVGLQKKEELWTTAHWPEHAPRAGGRAWNYNSKTTAVATHPREAFQARVLERRTVRPIPLGGLPGVGRLKLAPRGTSSKGERRFRPSA